MLRSPHRRRLVLAGALAALVAFGATGCAAFDEMEFFSDKSVRIVEPENLSTVTMPLEVRWEVDPSAPESDYAVFVDRYPMSPGETIRDLVDEEPSCRGNDECLTPDYLSRRFGILLTDDTHVTVDVFPPKAIDDGSDTHYVTLIRVDEEGRRIGETVWYASFRVES